MTKRRYIRMIVSFLTAQIMLAACGGEHFDIVTSEAEINTPAAESTANITTEETKTTKSEETTPVVTDNTYAEPAENKARILLDSKDTSEYGQITGWWADETINNGDTIPILAPWPAPSEDFKPSVLAMTFDLAFFQKNNIDKVVISTENGNGFLTGDIFRRLPYYYEKYGISNAFYFDYRQYEEITKEVVQAIYADSNYTTYWDIPEDPDHPCYIDIVYLKEDKTVGYSVLRGISDHTVIRFDVFYEALFTQTDLSREQAMPYLLAWHEGNMGPGEPMKQPNVPAPEQTTAWADNPAASAAPQSEKYISVVKTDDDGVYGLLIGKCASGSVDLLSLPIDILPEYYELMDADSIEIFITEEDAVLCPVEIGKVKYAYLLWIYETYGISDGLYKNMEVESPSTVYWDVPCLVSRTAPEHPFYINILYKKGDNVIGYSILKGDVEIYAAELFSVTFRVLHEAAFPDGPVTRDEAMVNLMRQHEK